MDAIDFIPNEIYWAKTIEGWEIVRCYQNDEGRLVFGFFGISHNHFLGSDVIIDAIHIERPKEE